MEAAISPKIGSHIRTLARLVEGSDDMIARWLVTTFIGEHLQLVPRVGPLGIHGLDLVFFEVLAVDTLVVILAITMAKIGSFAVRLGVISETPCSLGSRRKAQQEEGEFETHCDGKVWRILVIEGKHW